MNIKILGTKGEVKKSAPYHSRQSGVLINNQVLLDLGEEEFLKSKPRYVFITHLHPDHAFFIRQGLKFKGLIKASLWAPEEYTNRVKVKGLSGRKKAAGFQITTIPVIHSPKVRSHAYLLALKGKRLLYTGDVAWIKKEHRHLFGALDLVITEASFIRKGGMIRRHKKTGQIYGHTGVPDLIKMFSGSTKKMVFAHFGNWFFKQGASKARQEIRQFGEKYGIQAITAYDGLEVKI